MSTAPHLADAATRDDLVDWGPIATPIEGLSHTSGKVLHKDARRRRKRDLGLHARVPGAARSSARSSATSSPGRCTYTHDGGEVIEIRPGTIAVFPAGWHGRCTVHETVRKVYAIR